MKCQRCHGETYMPFNCQYCGRHFCAEHRLPENHDCSEYWRVRAPREQPAKATGTASTEPSYEYPRSMAPPSKEQGRIVWFSTTELKHLLIGVLLTLAIGFSMPLYGQPQLYRKPDVLTALAVIFAFSFIAHEIAHKIAAQHHGLWAEFRITTLGALITLLSIISPFKIISPGAVMIGGIADKNTIGKTSIMGPLTNITLALAFLVAARLLHRSVALYFGVSINSFIALFNLIPFGVLDGFKVFFWSKTIWTIVFLASLGLTVYSYIFFPVL